MAFDQLDNLTAQEYQGQDHGLDRETHGKRHVFARDQTAARRICNSGDSMAKRGNRANDRGVDASSCSDDPEEQIRIVTNAVGPRASGRVGAERLMHHRR